MTVTFTPEARKAAINAVWDTDSQISTYAAERYVDAALDAAAAVMNKGEKTENEKRVDALASIISGKVNLPTAHIYQAREEVHQFHMGYESGFAEGRDSTENESFMSVVAREFREAKLIEVEKVAWGKWDRIPCNILRACLEAARTELLRRQTKGESK